MNFGVKRRDSQLAVRANDRIARLLPFNSKSALKLLVARDAVLHATAVEQCLRRILSAHRLALRCEMNMHRKMYSIIPVLVRETVS